MIDLSAIKLLFDFLERHFYGTLLFRRFERKLKRIEMEIRYRAIYELELVKQFFDITNEAKD